MKTTNTFLPAIPVWNNTPICTTPAAAIVKKSALLMIILCIMFTARAQYFHSLYAQYSVLGNGSTTRYTGSGHVMAGATTNTPPALAPPQSLVVVHTDIDGNFTNPIDFNNIYRLFDGVTGIQLAISGTRIVELSNGSGYVVMGDYYAPGAGINSFGLFYLQLDHKGSVLAVQAYLDGVSSSRFRLTSITESTSLPGEIFATGTVDRNPFVMKIDPSGTVSWSFVYNFGPQQVSPNDILESPYAPELMVVGSSNMPGSIGRNGFWLVLDPGTGNITSAEEYNAGGTNDVFNAIAVSDDPFAPGFIIAATTNTSGAYRMCAVKAHTGRALLWTNLYTGPSTGTDQEGIDVVGRRNTSGKYEYYLAGSAFTGTTLSNVQAFKINDAGTAVSSGLFQYTIPGAYDKTASVDITMNGIGDGLSIYTTSGLLNGSMHHIKAYFNGVTACYYRCPDPVTIPVRYKISGIGGVQMNKLISTPMTYAPPIPYTDANICYAKVLSDGNNARPGPTDIYNLSGLYHIKVYPNPVTDELSITGLKEVSSYRLLSLTGANILQGVLQQGSNSITVKNLSTGMYMLEMTTAEGQRDIIKIVKE